jgi:hypothetical protein
VISWVYIDGALVGYQPTGAEGTGNLSYGVSLSGTHTLSFIIFDGGGLAGGNFRLETTSTPPPPLNPDLDGDGVLNDFDNCSLTANADQANNDGDTGGDVCDDDGVNDGEDAFPLDPRYSTFDETAPEITINGDADVELECTDSYVELGATAEDDRDGEVSVTVSGTVDSSTLGDYTITYTATDEVGNTSTTTRTVHVVDNTAPTVTAALVPVAGKSLKHNKGQFTVVFACEDGCDPNATPTATLNGIDVTNGQVVDLRLKSEKSGKSGKSDKSGKSRKSKKG